MSKKGKQPPAEIVPFVPAGKIRCFVTGKLRKDTPEENVRQRWARSLVDEYGYDVSDMAVEFSVKMGTKKETRRHRSLQAGWPAAAGYRCRDRGGEARKRFHEG